ncbi:MAG: hypothetical protein B6U86_04635 [Candidatus Altiarchaeales archaeon ex4484_43]|nr:MAG: hypothetical protein B6U86_04635 [Candidatus Altiarchaeales archaeon ex4484_43]
MKIIPAIDILDGDCVQLIGGKLGTQEYYGDPVEIALEFRNMGAEILHIIDLDAALISLRLESIASSSGHWLLMTTERILPQSRNSGRSSDPRGSWLRWTQKEGILS